MFLTHKKRQVNFSSGKSMEIAKINSETLLKNYKNTPERFLKRSFGSVFFIINQFKDLIFCVLCARSPPHIRRKAFISVETITAVRITPAHAGKRIFTCIIDIHTVDHPPHMQGKGNIKTT